MRRHILGYYFNQDADAVLINMDSYMCLLLFSDVPIRSIITFDACIYVNVLLKSNVMAHITVFSFLKWRPLVLSSWKKQNVNSSETELCVHWKWNSNLAFICLKWGKMAAQNRFVRTEVRCVPVRLLNLNRIALHTWCVINLRAITPI